MAGRGRRKGKKEGWTGIGFTGPKSTHLDGAAPADGAGFVEAAAGWVAAFAPDAPAFADDAAPAAADEPAWAGAADEATVFAQEL